MATAKDTEANQPAPINAESSVPFPQSAPEPGPSSAPQAPGHVRRPTHTREPSKYRRHYRTASGNLAFGRHAKRRADARARERFLKALVIGTVVWLIFGFALGWIGFSALSGRRPITGDPLPPPPTDGSVVVCANYTNEFSPLEYTTDSISATTTPSSTASSILPYLLPFHYFTSAPFRSSSSPPPTFVRQSHPISSARRRGDKSTTFTVPLESGSVFFLHGSGPFGQGTVKYLVDDSVDREDVEGDVDVMAGKNGLKAKVKITPITTDVRLLGLVNICHMRKDDGAAAGIGVYANFPDNGVPDDSKLAFEVVVTLPRRAATQVGSIKADGHRLAALEVRGPSWTIDAKNLNHVNTERVDFETQVGDIRLGAVKGKEIRARTSVGDIVGQFHVADYLSLTTNDGDISGQVSLLDPSTVSLSTLPIAPAHPPPVALHPIGVHVSAAAGDINLSYVSHPLTVSLNSYASANDGSVHVTHLPAFEGDFELETSWGKAQIVGEPGKWEEKDPSGEGRKRTLEIRKRSVALGYSHITGTVWWADEKDPGKDQDRRERGTSKVETVQGDGTIEFA